MKHSDNVACKIAEDMHKLLLSEKYSRKDVFLSSRQAAELYNVSHVTASRALHILSSEGVIKSLAYSIFGGGYQVPARRCTADNPPP